MPESREMHIVHLTMDLSEAAGGVAQVVGSLCSSLSKLPGVRVSLLSSGFDEIKQEIDLDHISQFQMRPTNFSSCYQLLKELHLEQPIDVIHDHGQWMPFNLSSAWFSHRFQIPRVVSPHGMVTPAARNHRRLKKRIAWSLYAKRCLQQASLIHVTSEQELAHVKALVARPTITIPNGINSPSNAKELIGKPREKIIAFLGRIHPIKGVPELLKAWERSKRNDWTLCIAGPDEVGLFLGRTVPDGVQLLGSLGSSSKFDFLARSSVLILPSHSENFGIVVPEALCVGTPVIATQGTPWKCLAEKRIGWWVELTVESLAGALTTAMETPSERLREMGVRGSRFVSDRYSWQKIAEQFSDQYSKLIR